MFGFHGYSVVVKDPVPVYNRVRMFKKHRKKRNWQPRVKVFSHYVELIEDGQVIRSEIYRSLFMNRKTFDQMNRALKKG